MPIQDIWPKTVPDVRNLDQSAAENTLDELLIPYEYAASQYSATVDEGAIISQDPAPATEINLGSTITLTVSLGESPDTGFGAGLLIHKRKRRYRAKRFRKVIYQ